MTQYTSKVMPYIVEDIVRLTNLEGGGGNHAHFLPSTWLRPWYPIILYLVNNFMNSYQFVLLNVPAYMDGCNSREYY